MNTSILLVLTVCILFSTYVALIVVVAYNRRLDDKSTFESICFALKLYSDDTKKITGEYLGRIMHFGKNGEYIKNEHAEAGQSQVVLPLKRSQAEIVLSVKNITGHPVTVEYTLLSCRLYTKQKSNHYIDWSERKLLESLDIRNWKIQNEKTKKQKELV